jgi:TolB-like protein
MRPLIILAVLTLAAGPLHDSHPVARKTIAVLAFDNNTGKTDYDHLGKGMSTMMTNDLASVDQIRVVERERLSDVLKEIDAQQTTRFDSTTAVKVGRLAGAEYIVTGAFIASDPQMRIDTRVIQVETGIIVKTATVTGKSDHFLDLQKKLARQLIKDLDVALTPVADSALDRRQQANGIDDVKDVAHFSNAIDLADNGNYADAAVKMAPLVSKYPNSIIVKMTSEEISKRAAKSAKDKVKQKANEKIGGLLRKKWPPQ